MVDAFTSAAQSLVLVSPPPTGSASGVVVTHKNGGTYILTCKHVVGKLESLDVETDSLKATQARVVKISRSHDLAIIKTGSRLEIPEIEIAEENPSPYDQCFMVGNPGGQWGVPALGIVGQLDEEDELVQISMLAASGCSGSPVVNVEGKLFGILSSGLLKGSQELPGVSFAVSLDPIRKFLRRL